MVLRIVFEGLLGAERVGIRRTLCVFDHVCARKARSVREKSGMRSFMYDEPALDEDVLRSEPCRSWWRGRKAEGGAVEEEGIERVEPDATGMPGHHNNQHGRQGEGNVRGQAANEWARHRAAAFMRGCE